MGPYLRSSGTHQLDPGRGAVPRKGAKRGGSGMGQAGITTAGARRRGGAPHWIFLDLDEAQLAHIPVPIDVAGQPAPPDPACWFPSAESSVRG